MKKYFKRAACNQYGIISPLILIGVITVLVVFVILGMSPIKNKLLGGLFPKQSSHASGAVANLNLLPANTTVAPNTAFTVDVVVSPQSVAVSGVQADITFDPTKLKATDIKIGSVLSQALDPCTFQLGVCTVPFAEAIKYTNASKTTQTGVIHFSAGVKTGDPFVTTPVRVATITFQSLVVTTVPSQIIINSAGTLVAGADPATGTAIPGDIKGDLTQSVVVISNSPSITKTADFSLTAPASAAPGSQFNLVLKAKSPEAANLFAAELNFDPALLNVVSINTTGSFVTQWVNNNSFDNAAGWISLIGGVPTPGFTSSTAATMATITFQAKSTGSTQVSFAANSAIYRNSDNANILITPVTGSTTNISGGAASASPSPVASPSQSPAASPSPSGSSTACAITSANWITSVNPVNEGQIVGLNVVGNANCAGQNINFVVSEDDNLVGGALGGTDPVKNDPSGSKFNSNGIATTSWVAEYQDDPSLINNNVPEYFFTAKLGNGQTFDSVSPELQVSKLVGGAFLTGDANKDRIVDRVDLSILLSNWNKTSNFIDALDLNLDGVVNSVDWATMIQILRVNGVIQ